MTGSMAEGVMGGAASALGGPRRNANPPAKSADVPAHSAVKRIQHLPLRPLEIVISGGGNVRIVTKQVGKGANMRTEGVGAATSSNGRGNRPPGVGLLVGRQVHCHQLPDKGGWTQVKQQSPR